MDFSPCAVFGLRGARDDIASAVASGARVPDAIALIIAEYAPDHVAMPVPYTSRDPPPIGFTMMIATYAMVYRAVKWLVATA